MEKLFLGLIVTCVLYKSTVIFRKVVLETIAARNKQKQKQILNYKIMGLKEDLKNRKFKQGYRH